MYQGYSKGRYRQVKKTSFEHAKKEVIIALNTCNINIMQKFINRLYKFIDAYRKGLSAKAAIQCIKKQKRYRVILKGAMRAFKDYIKA